MALFPDPMERFIDRDANGRVIRSWSKLLASATYGTLDPPYILDAQAVRLDWAGTATSINGAGGLPYAFVDEFFNKYTDLSQGRVVVPKGFPLMPSDFTLSARSDLFRGDTVDQLLKSRVKICEFDEDSSGNYSGRVLGVAFKDYYMPVYARQLSEIVTIVDSGIIEIPFFQSSAATGGRELSRLVTKITSLAKNANTDVDIRIGDDVTIGTGVDRGRFVKIGASNANSHVVGQIIDIETVDPTLGVRGYMALRRFDPFFLFREGSWYTDYDFTEGESYPLQYSQDYMLPPYNWFDRGLRGLTDGSEYRVTVEDSATFTATALQTAFIVDIGPYAKTFGSAKIVRADGTEITTSNAFAVGDITLDTANVTLDGADDSANWAINGVTAVSDTTVDSGYAQHILVTFTRDAGANAGEVIVIPFSFVAKGQHTGLPVSLDDPYVAGIAQVKLTLR